MIQSKTAASDLNLIENADNFVANGIPNHKPTHGKHNKIHVISESIPMQPFVMNSIPTRKRSVISVASEKIAKSCWQITAVAYKKQATNETSLILALQVVFYLLQIV